MPISYEDLDKPTEQIEERSNEIGEKLAKRYDKIAAEYE